MRINYATCLKEVGLVFQPKNSLEGANLSSKRPQLEGHTSSSIGTIHAHPMGLTSLHEFIGFVTFVYLPFSVRSLDLSFVASLV